LANQFDDFTRGLASARSRRAALKVIGIGAVGAAAGVFTLFRGGTAEAGRGGCLSKCRGKRGADFNDCVRRCTCRESGGHICEDGRSVLCCPPWTRCSTLNFLESLSESDDTDDTSENIFCIPISTGESDDGDSG
jgi:hypothetical protein